MAVTDLFLEIGYLATGSVETVDRLFSLNRNINISDIARLITVFFSTHTGHVPRVSPPDLYRLTGIDVRDATLPATWNVNNLLAGALNQGVDCTLESLLNHLDIPEFEIRDYPAVTLFSQMITFFIKNPMDFPVIAVTKKWKNPRAQFSVLIALIRFLPNALANITRPIIAVDQLAKGLPPTVLKSPWMNLDLLGSLVNLCRSEIGQEVVSFMETVCLQCPECFLLGLAQLKIDDIQGVNDLSLKLGITFIVGHPNASFVLSKLWSINQNLLLASLIRTYLTDPSSLSRILDIAQELKILPKVLETKPFTFSIDLATLASRRDYLNLEKWLQEHIRSFGAEFIQTVLQYLRDRISILIGRDKNGVKHPSTLSADTMGTFIKVLGTHQSMLVPEQIELIKQLSAAASQIFAKEEQVQAAHFSPDIEEETGRYFEKLYKGEVSVLDMISALKKCQTSSNPREQELFKCIIKSLFEEYKFYPNYPDKMLALTGVFFGSIIQHEVVSGNALGIALRGVLDALRQPPGTAMNRFGAQALMQFQSRLQEWPQFTSMLAQIDHLKLTNPDIAVYLERLAQKPIEAEEEAEQELFSCVKVFSLPEDPNEKVPESKLQDKILFLINNVSDENIEPKVSELKSLLSSEYFRWFSDYLVDKRVCIEPNFHAIYVSFLDKMESKVLETHVLHATFSKIKLLIGSEKTVSASSERTLLKNLGIWLGLITLAKNKPIKFNQISFKDLLLQGYDSGRLIVVIPFVCKVLEQTKNSKIFEAPNPWLMAIMKLLSELYHFAELKLNLKFEIEVLCKNIHLDIKEITPSGILKERPIKPKIEQQMQKMKLADAETGETSASSDALNLLSNLPSLITFNPSIPIISGNPAMRRVISLSFDRAVREIIGPVVERSVSIAGIAARELILKDFALEPDENKLRKASHVLAASLAGSLASVTCREPLRIGIIQQIRNVLLQNGYTEHNLPDQAIFLVVSENLDIACSIIQKTAAENAITEIDASLAGAFMNRRKHRERTGQPYFDMNVYSSLRYPNNFAEVLKLKPTGVSASQMKVYEEFIRLPEHLERSRAGSLRGEAKQESGSSNVNEEVGGALSIAVCLEKMNQLLNEIQISGSIDQSVCRQVNQWIISSVSKDDVALVYSQVLIGLLFKSPSSESLKTLIQQVLQTSLKATKEVIMWFLYSADDRKYSAPVFLAMLDIGALSVLDIDMHLFRFVEAKDKQKIEFAVEYLLSCTSKQLPVDYFLTCSAIKRGLPGLNTESLISLIQEQEQISFSRNDEKLIIELAAVFSKWSRLCAHPNVTEQYQIMHVNHLIQRGIVQGDDLISSFIRVGIEESIKDYISKSSQLPVQNAIVYSSIDSFSKLIVMIMNSVTSESLKLNIITKSLSIALLVLVDAHEHGKQQFNQKPYFRLFSSLLSYFNDMSNEFKSISFQTLSAFSNTMHTMQPSFLPGFTFSWLQLVCHRHFMPKLLKSEGQKGWPYFQRLLVDLFKFMSPFLQKSEFPESIRQLYRGTLRCLLILLHDFPEFLCSYHLTLMDNIPVNCIQVRNLILSAFPAGMKLPDPFTPNLKFEMLPEINQSPVIHSDYVSVLNQFNIKSDLDGFLTGMKSGIPDDLVQKLVSHGDPSNRYNIQLLNSLVIYCGLQAISQHLSSQPGTTIASIKVQSSKSFEIFSFLMSALDSEGRYLVLSSMANQLRYPNSHTFYFSCLLLQLFADSGLEIVQEQMTRVMLERLIVNRPHPYGTLITFIELIRNPKYKFWEHSHIIRCAPEIERLFTQVAKSVNSSFNY